MPALVAARFNPDMKAKYAHLIKTGKPAKVALTAIMRRLVVLANALLKGTRKCPPKGKSHLDPKNRLINTDTLEIKPLRNRLRANKGR
jgi:hypothetical protein